VSTLKKVKSEGREYIARTFIKNHRLSTIHKDEIFVNGVPEFIEYDEQLAYAKWFFYESSGNLDGIRSLLSGAEEITLGTRNFIDDILSGRIKAKGKVKKRFIRDLNIYTKICDLLDKGYALTSNSNKKGAAAEVANEVTNFHKVSEEMAIKIYQRMTQYERPDDCV
jgi:hypothetical protein